MEDYSLRDIKEELDLPKKLKKYLEIDVKNVSRKIEKNISEILNLVELKDEYKGLIYFSFLHYSLFIRRNKKNELNYLNYI